MKAIIQAGGKGTRVSELTGGVVPKSLSRIIDKPLISYQLRSLFQCGITEVLITANHDWQIQLFKQSIAIGEFSQLAYTFNIHEWQHPYEIFLAEDVSDFIGESDIFWSYGDIVFLPELIERMTSLSRQNGTSVGCKMLSRSPRWSLEGKYMNFTEDTRGLVTGYEYADTPNFTIHAPFLINSRSLKIVRDAVKTNPRNIFIIQELTRSGQLSIVEPELLVNTNTPEDLAKVKGIILRYFKQI